MNLSNRNISKIITIAILLVCAFVFFVGSLKRVESGQVGVIRSFTGEYKQELADVGIHHTILRKIQLVSIKEIPISLTDLRPTAKDKISLEDLDFEVQYHINPQKARDLLIKYGNLSLTDKSGVVAVGYLLVDKQAKSVSADAVSKFDSLIINEKRVELEQAIKENLQKDLDENDPDSFIISRVSISNIKPDSKIQDSIRRITESENRKQEALNNLEIAKTQAEENRIRSQTLTDKVLAERQLQTLEVMAKSGNLIVVPMDFKGIINANSQK